MKAEAIAAVRRAVRVKLEPEHAFELFTRDLARWWPLATHSCSGDAAATVAFDGVGGKVIETASDGSRHVWGTVIEWNPPHSFAMSRHPAQPAQLATRVEVRFLAVENGTEVQLVHSGWEVRGADAGMVRDRYDGGWNLVLVQFVVCAGEAR